MQNNYSPFWPQDIITAGEKIVASLDFTNTTPSRDDVLRFLRFDPRQIKVVIIGQDPYPGRGVANGRAFAVNKGQKIPASLRNIFSEIRATCGIVFADETLESWERQGVLLLNMSLTTEVGRPLAHVSHWRGYVPRVIEFVNTASPQASWVLWGAHAQKIAPVFTGRIIFDSHPSPLSFHRRSGVTFRELKQIKW